MKHNKLKAVAFGLALAGTFAVSAQAQELALFKIVDETIPVSLTGKSGDAVNGKKVAINRKKGNCLACHEMPIPEQQFHGKTGPSLLGVAHRLDEASMRMRIVDPKVVNDHTMMPSFYKIGQHRVLKKFVGKTILSAQEVEDIVAYLKTLN